MASNNLLQKWEPLSLIIALGVPKQVNMFLCKNFKTVRVSFVLVAMTSTHLDTNQVQLEYIGSHQKKHEKAP